MQPIELFSNFFLMSEAQNQQGKQIMLDVEPVSTALKEALVARSELQTVYVICTKVSKLKAFVNALIIEVGKVDFSEVNEIRLMNDCIFLP